MSRQVNLPDANGNRCYSSKGWLLVIGKTLNCFLLHPFSNTRIDLPHINTFRPNRWGEDQFWFAQIVCAEKFVLSASPSLTSDYTVLLLVEGDVTELAYFRPGFRSWVKIDAFQGCCYDAIYCQGKFYAINTIGGLFAIDIKSDHSVTCEQLSKLPSRMFNLDPEIHHLYLAELAGKLLVLNRRYLRNFDEDGNGGGGTGSFDVFEVDLKNDKCLKIKDLGKRLIFVGFNSSIVVEIPKDTSCFKPNCVYFTDEEVVIDFSGVIEGRSPPSKDAGKDIGVYNLIDGSIEAFFMPEYSSFDQMSPHIWIEQSF